MIFPMIYRPNPKSNLNTLYVVMTSSKPRRYLSHVVYVDLLSHGTHCVSQSLLLRSSSLSHIKTFTSPLLAVLTHQQAITVLQTHKRKYRHIAQPKNKQYIIIIIIPVLHATAPRLMIPTVTSLPLHNAYSKTYIIGLH